MRDGNVFYTNHDHVHVLRYVGDIRHPLAPSVGSFIDLLFERTEIDRFIVNLSDADAIDSTNLGEIARLANLLEARGSKRATIVSTRAEVSQVLYSMAFDEVFDISTEPISGEAGEMIPIVACSRERSLEIILAAHRRLSEMSASNQELFGEVVNLMERELQGPGPSSPRPSSPRPPRER